MPKICNRPSKRRNPIDASLLVSADLMLQRISGALRAAGASFNDVIEKPLLDGKPWTQPIALVIKYVSAMSEEPVDAETLLEAILLQDKPIAIATELQSAIHFLNRIAATQFSIGDPVPTSWHDSLVDSFTSTPLVLADRIYGFDVLGTIASTTPSTPKGKKSSARETVEVSISGDIVKSIKKYLKTFDPSDERSSRINVKGLTEIIEGLGYDLSANQLYHIMGLLQDRGIIVKGDIVKYKGFEKHIALHTGKKHREDALHSSFSALRGPSTYYLPGKYRAIFERRARRPRPLVAGKLARKIFRDIPVRISEEELEHVKQINKQQRYAHKQTKVDQELVDLALEEWAGDNRKNLNKVARIWRGHNLSLKEFLQTVSSDLDWTIADKEQFLKQLDDDSTSRLNLRVNKYALPPSVRENVNQYKRETGKGYGPQDFFTLKGWNQRQIEQFKKILNAKCAIKVK